MIKIDKSRLINNLAGTFYILLAAFLWGSSFAVRKIGMENIGPLMMNTVRFLLAFIFMIAIVLIRRRFVSVRKASVKEMESQIKTGIIIGIPYAFNVVLQQIGLNTVSAGETGFITSLYTVMVPILGWLILKQRIRPVNLIAIILSAVGLYFVTNGGLSFNFGMVILFAGSVCAAIQILLIGKYIGSNDPFILTTVQIGVGTLINMIMAIVTKETFSPHMVKAAIGPIVYSGVASIGVANLCQFLGQRKVSPTVTAVACSFESVFGLLFGVLLLGETITLMKACGCALIFITVILVQYDPGHNLNKGI